MQIVVKYEPSTFVRLKDKEEYDEWDGDGRHIMLRCAHDNLVVEPPCCNGTDCDCRGEFTTYCPDCENEDLLDEESWDRLGSHFDRGDD